MDSDTDKQFGREEEQEGEFEAVVESRSIGRAG
jgi:hypothetical protein